MTYLYTDGNYQLPNWLKAHPVGRKYLVHTKYFNSTQGPVAGKVMKPTVECANATFLNKYSWINTMIKTVDMPKQMG